MIKGIICSVVIGTSSILPSIANDSKISRGYFTMDAMGCMLVQECTDNVRQIQSIQDIQKNYPDSNYSSFDTEFNDIISALNKIGVMVFLAPQKYFPIGHRGVYHTVGNNFFLNDAYMHRESNLREVVRHEGWHVAQDCMGGNVKNNTIAIILNPDDIPNYHKILVSEAYSSRPSSIPWEQEAHMAGNTKNMTRDALKVCASSTPIWEVYPPTPFTREFLVEEGYIKE